MGRIESNLVRLAVKRKAPAEEQVIRLDCGVIRQAELPKGNLVCTLLPMVRVQIHQNEDRFVTHGRHAHIGEDVLVPAFKNWMLFRASANRYFA